MLHALPAPQSHLSLAERKQPFHKACEGQSGQQVFFSFQGSAWPGGRWPRTGQLAWQDLISWPWFCRSGEGVMSGIASHSLLAVRCDNGQRWWNGPWSRALPEDQRDTWRVFCVALAPHIEHLNLPGTNDWRSSDALWGCKDEWTYSVMFCDMRVFPFNTWRAEAVVTKCFHTSFYVIPRDQHVRNTTSWERKKLFSTLFRCFFQQFLIVLLSFHGNILIARYSGKKPKWNF